jgi:NAD(P)-dependent dehydrogenase (short-subunit alcohol dehydrogenase family)
MSKIIITGSSGLIGKPVTEYFKKQNYEVVECDLSLGHDLTNENFVKDFFLKNKSNYILNLFAFNDHVNNAGSTNNLFDIKLSSFTKYLDVNLTALFSVCREYARNNSTGGIVNVSSLYAVNSPDPYLYKKIPTSKKEKHIAYGITKAGVEQLTRHLAVHLSPNFNVNCVAPGGIGEASQPDYFVERFVSKTLCGRMMHQKDLFGIFKFLCSSDSEYTTGQTFRINGGYSLK